MVIVFYSHRVNYPTALSAQTLPLELKNKVVNDLENLKSQIVEYPIVQKHSILKNVTLQQIQDNINFLQARDLSHLWKDCVEFNRRLDKTRKQDFLSANPLFKPYV